MMNDKYKIKAYNSSNHKYLPIKKTIKHVENVLIGENSNSSFISIIFVDKDEILRLNVEYLNHHYYTDVITFSLNDDDRFIDAEIYICVDVAEEQAVEYKVSLSNELLRLAVHGTLHLCGYKDKSEEEQKLMRQLEDKYLG